GGQVVVLGGAVGDQLEDGVVAEGVVVVLVLVAGQDAVDAGIIEGAREGPGEPSALIELADGEQPGVAGQLARRQLEDERRTEEVEDLWPGEWYTHRLPPRLRTGPGASTG